MIITEIMSKIKGYYGEEVMAQTSNGMRIAYEGDSRSREGGGTRGLLDKQGAMFLVTCSFPEGNNEPTFL